MDNVLSVFSNPIVIVIICVAFGFPILAGIVKLIQKKFFRRIPVKHEPTHSTFGCRKKIRRETQEIKKEAGSENNFRSALFGLKGYIEEGRTMYSELVRFHLLNTPLL